MDFNQLLKQAQAVKEQMEKTDADLKKKEYANSVVQAQIKAVVNGDYEIVSLELNEEMVKDGDAAMIQDVVKAAVNDCLTQAKKDKESSVAGMASQMGLPTDL